MDSLLCTTFPQNKKRRSRKPCDFRDLVFFEVQSVGRRSRNGANAFASAALDAGIRVDLIFAVAFGNGGHGAFAFASAASDAGIGDFISHGVDLLGMDFLRTERLYKTIIAQS